MGGYEGLMDMVDESTKEDSGYRKRKLELQEEKLEDRRIQRRIMMKREAREEASAR